jgi:hypothetical protein
MGSSAARCASAGAEAGALCGAGAGVGWACASLIQAAAISARRSTSIGDGIANACGAPDITKHHASHAADETRYRAKIDLSQPLLARFIQMGV